MNTLMKNILSVTLLTIGLMAVPAMADEGAPPADQAQQMLCNKRSEVMKNLSANYNEAPTALGMASNGGILEVMTSRDGKTWTVLLTTPDGKSCLVAMGNSWENVKLVAAGPDA
ncbi:MAG TPA: hypothetical protein PKW15_04240 [Alphaproteobacteria bacterium]|nr:hypothetical protein [Rhodospirillaceae bacterium]HRJ12438.1 hypothetical protein [Alphaproteobacteria bacterium]